MYAQLDLVAGFFGDGEQFDDVLEVVGEKDVLGRDAFDAFYQDVFGVAMHAVCDTS